MAECTVCGRGSYHWLMPPGASADPRPAPRPAPAARPGLARGALAIGLLAGRLVRLSVCGCGLRLPPRAAFAAFALASEASGCRRTARLPTETCAAHGARTQQCA